MAIVVVLVLIGIIVLVFRNSFKNEKACCSDFKAKGFSMTGSCRTDCNLENKKDDEK